MGKEGAELIDFMILIGITCIPALWSYMWVLKVDRNEEFLEWLDTFVDLEWDLPIDYKPLRNGRPI